jgi:hypothetical protein
MHARALKPFCTIRDFKNHHKNYIMRDVSKEGINKIPFQYTLKVVPTNILYSLNHEFKNNFFFQNCQFSEILVLKLPKMNQNNLCSMWDLNLGQWVQTFNGIVRQWHNWYKEVSLINKINYVEMFKIQESCAKA